jgi:hypothetical protein
MSGEHFPGTARRVTEETFYDDGGSDYLQQNQPGETDYNHEIEEEIKQLSDEYMRQFNQFTNSKSPDNYLAGFSFFMANDVLGSNETYRSIREGITNLLRRRREHATESISLEANFVRSVFQHEILNNYLHDLKFNNAVNSQYSLQHTGYRGEFPWVYKDENGNPLPASQVDLLQVAQDWAKAMDYIVKDKAATGGIETLGADVIDYNIQTNQVQRYAVVKLDIAYQQMIGNTKPMRFLDVGSSVAHGIRAVDLDGINGSPGAKSKYFKPVKVVPLDGSGSADQRQIIQLNLNRIIEGSVGPVGPSTAIDIKPLDERTKLWAKACLRQSELADKEFMRVYDELDSDSVKLTSNVSFVRHNLLDESDHQEEIPEEKKFDRAVIATVLNQIPKEKRKLFFQRTTRYLRKPKNIEDENDGGKIYALDFGEPALPEEDVDGTGIALNKSMYDENFQYPYKVIVIDPFRDTPPQVVMQFDSGRCNSAILMPNDYIDWNRFNS